MLAYKLVRAHKNGYYTSLYHGTRGTRILPEYEWYGADSFPIDDGKRTYMAGFQCFRTRGDAEKYLKRFKKPNNICIVECQVDEIEIKPSNPDVLLAGNIYLMT